VAKTEFTVKELTEGMEYEFRIKAENQAGLSKPSPSTSTVVKEPVSKWLDSSHTQGILH
jgi:DNA topoisomerase VI subunit B